MIADKRQQASRQLHALNAAFKEKLPARLAELHAAAADLTLNAPAETRRQALTQLRALAHRLAGTAGIFGFARLGECSLQLEQMCEATSQPGEAELAQIFALLQRLDELAKTDGAHRAELPQDYPPPALIPKPAGVRILLVEDDPALGQQLSSVLPCFGFEVAWRDHPGELLQAVREFRPGVLLMDIAFPEGRDLGVTAVRDLRAQGALDCPVIFISVRNDFDARLQATRLGSNGYLTKPLDIPDLVENLQHLVDRSQEPTYRVMAVDDDADLLDWYRQILSDAGFEVETLAAPDQAISLLRRFRPDVILMDIEMPRCNGLELAGVIRQHVDYLQIPIVFITGHASRDNRQDAWRSGGDDFISKPVQPATLIPSLRARAEKSRALVSLSVHQKTKASRERFHALANISPVATLYTNAEGLCLFVNARFTEMTRTTAEQAFGRHWTHWIDPQDRPGIMDAWVAAATEARGFEAEFRLGAAPDPLWVIGRTAAQLGDDGQVAGYAVTLTDIAELKHASEALEQAKQMLETTFASIQDVVLVIDLETAVILQTNASSEPVLGYRSSEINGRRLQELFSDPADYQRYTQRMREELKAFGAFRADVRMTGRDGRLLLAEHTVTPLRTQHRPDKAVIVIRDVTEPRALSERLAYQSTHDPLTGLFNRLEFERRLELALARAGKSESRAVLCYLDLDRFKLINDTCGHAAGDQVLREIGGILRNKIRRVDTLARLGGDEFAVLMDECNLQQAHRVAASLLQVIEHYRFNREGQLFTLGVSIGLVEVDHQMGNIGNLLMTADSACYAAKEKGRHCIHVYRNDDEKLLRHHDEARCGMLIERSLESDGFELFYQPIVAFDGCAAEGRHFELLLRMRDENGIPMLPGQFLAAADHFHLSSRIDRWVVKTALAWLGSDAERLQRIQICAINLSGQSLGDKRFLDYVLECFERYGVAPHRVCFEITETAAISDIDQALHFIKQLKLIGCRFALDDFGTGVSSFAYLKNLPVDYLKIDGSFIKDMLHDPLDQAMVKSINEIGHVLGKKTIAEYVEDADIMHQLRLIGVDFAQGFHTGVPSRLSDFPVDDDR